MKKNLGVNSKAQLDGAPLAKVAITQSVTPVPVKSLHKKSASMSKTNSSVQQVLSGIMPQSFLGSAGSSQIGLGSQPSNNASQMSLVNSKMLSKQISQDNQIQNSGVGQVSLVNTHGYNHHKIPSKQYNGGSIRSSGQNSLTRASQIVQNMPGNTAGGRTATGMSDLSGISGALSGGNSAANGDTLGMLSQNDFHASKGSSSGQNTINLQKNNANIIISNGQKMGPQHNISSQIGSSRKAQKIQIHMKNSRFVNRKSSMPEHQQNITSKSQMNSGQIIHEMQQNSGYNSNFGSLNSGATSAMIGKLENIGKAKYQHKRSASNQVQGSQSKKGVQEGGVAGTAGRHHRPQSKSKSMQRKERGNSGNANGSFGRTFFHPSNSGVADQQFQSQQPVDTMDKNEINMMSHSQFASTSNAPLNQVYSTTNPNAINPMDIAKKKAQLLQAEPSVLSTSMNNGGTQKFLQQYGGSQSQVSSLARINNQYDSRHNAGMLHKHSNSEINQYNNSVERFKQNGKVLPQQKHVHSISINRGNDSTKGQTTGSKKDRRANSVLSQQQTAQLKQNLQKTQQAVFKNNSYQINKNNRKNIKASQKKKDTNNSSDFSTSMVHPNSFNSTQNIRFQTNPTRENQSNPYPSNQTQPIPMIFNEQSQTNLGHGNTLSFGGQNLQEQSQSQPGSTYMNTQIIERLFNSNNSNSNNALLPSATKQNSSVKKKNSKSLSNNDFSLPQHASNTQLFTANNSNNTSQHQMVSAYQLQQLQSKGSLKVHSHASSNNMLPNNSGGQGIKTNKNNQYLQQQINIQPQNINSKQRVDQRHQLVRKVNRSKQGSGQVSHADLLNQDQKSKNIKVQHHHSKSQVGVQRFDQVHSNFESEMPSALGSQKNSIQGLVKVSSQSKRSNKHAQGSNSVVLGVPADMSPDKIVRIGSKSSQRAKLIEVDSTHLSASNLNKNYNSSKDGNLIFNNTAYQKTTFNKTNTPLTKISSAKKKHPSGTRTPSTDGEPLNIYQSNQPSQTQVMVQDGGTGASLKKVFLCGDSAHTSVADSQSNYGGNIAQNQTYQLPLKGVSSKGMTQQQKKMIIQRASLQQIQASQRAREGLPASITETKNLKKLNSKQESLLSTEVKTQDKTYSNDINLQVYGADMNKLSQGGISQESYTTQTKVAPKQAPSINITEEARRIGKLPTETVAKNIALGLYNKQGILKQAKNTSRHNLSLLPSKTADGTQTPDLCEEISPRVQEMIHISNLIKQKFAKSETAPETTTEFYRAGKMLGRGAFGKVNLGMHKLTRKLIAIKSINKEYLSEEKQRNKVMHEVGILLRLRHQSVVKLYETFETRRHIMLVMELCAGGDLLNFVRKRKKLEENVAKVLFKQIIEGIGYIHSKRILHRDIKLDNILLDGKGGVKIADFGVSKAVKKGEVMFEQSGTPAYIAPEIIKDKGYKGFKADLWSAGVVLFALLYGTVPFKASNMKDLHQQIINAKYNMKDEISDDAKSLIRGLLTTDPKKRLGVSQVLKHPWMIGVESIQIEIFNDEEKEVIRSEFTYNDPSRYNRNEKVKWDEEPWDCFTELNLDSMNQTLRNASTKSLILAPFNSTMSDVEKFLKECFEMAPVEPKKQILKFAARCRDQDRQYEINNNAELDNGVYHKFVYSSKESKEQSAEKKAEQRGEEPLLSRNSSRVAIDAMKNKTFESQDLTKAKDPKKQVKNKEFDALKADFKRQMKENKKQEIKITEHSSDDEDYEIYETHASAHSVQADPARVKILEDFGYPYDYICNSVGDNEANYCLAAYYLLAIDQNY